MGAEGCLVSAAEDDDEVPGVDELADTGAQLVVAGFQVFAGNCDGVGVIERGDMVDRKRRQCAADSSGAVGRADATSVTTNSLI